MRIAGISLPDEKRMEIALTAVYGIGRSQAKRILDACSIEHGSKASELNEEQEQAIRAQVDEMTIEGDLKRERSGNVKRLIDIMANRGMRHSRGLPTRGQTTKTNSRTVRGGGRKTMGSGRVKVSKT